MGKLSRTFGLLLSAGLGLVACDDLPKLPSDVCGNGVIEDGEDCDGASVGQNSCNALCRLECTSNGACPAGFGCGSDGLCRQPTGTFAPFGPALALSAERLTLADFDGDGQNDLLASRGSSLSVAYVGPQGLLPETTTIAHTPIDVYPDVPAVLDIDGDGRADLASRLGPNIGVLRGQQDRTLLPLPFSWQIPVLKETDELLLAETDPAGPGPELYVVRPDGIFLAYARDPALSGLPKKVLSYDHGGQLPHVTVAGQTYPSAGGRLVLAWDDDTEVSVYSPFYYVQDPMTGLTSLELNLDGAVAAPVVVALPAGANVSGPVLTGSLTGQNNYGDDLVIHAKKAGEDKLYVAFGCQSGTWGSLPQNNGQPGDGTSRELVRKVDGVVTKEVPLAVGHLDSNTRLDFVAPSGIQLAQCLGSQCPLKFEEVNPTPDTPVVGAYATAAKPESASGWTGAIVVPSGDLLGQFVGATFGEVVTTSADPGYTFFKRAAGDALNPFRIQTQSPVLHPQAGDFNGDGAPDLVFSQVSTRAPAQNPDLESVHVAFGDPYGIPRQLSDLGDVGKVQSIFSARIIDAFASESSSGLSDALVRTKTAKGPEYYLFAGSTDGTLQSALSLSSQCSGVAKSPRGIPRFMTLARAFGGARIVSLYRGESGGTYEYKLWSAGLTASGSVDICKTLVGPAGVEASSNVDVAMEAVDLDGDLADETLLLPKGESGKLYVAKEGATEWKVDELSLGGPASGLALVNLGRTSANGVALIDVAVVTPAGVTLLWNDGNGALDVAKATAIKIAGIEYETRKGVKKTATEPLGVAAVSANANGSRALAIVTAEDTFLVELSDATARKFGEPQRRSVVFGGGGDAVTAGDIDGDGVDDLVIARPGGIQIWSGVPVVK
ncbi:MAG: VCBS repeat-containing protein [Polyangiaceae bacterium]